MVHLQVSDACGRSCLLLSFASACMGGVYAELCIMTFRFSRAHSKKASDFGRCALDSIFLAPTS